MPGPVLDATSSIMLDFEVFKDSDNSGVSKEIKSASVDEGCIEYFYNPFGQNNRTLDDYSTGIENNVVSFLGNNSQCLRSPIPAGSDMNFDTLVHQNNDLTVPLSSTMNDMDKTRVCVPISEMPNHLVKLDWEKEFYEELQKVDERTQNQLGLFHYLGTPKLYDDADRQELDNSGNRANSLDFSSAKKIINNPADSSSEQEVIKVNTLASEVVRHDHLNIHLNSKESSASKGKKIKQRKVMQPGAKGIRIAHKSYSLKEIASMHIRVFKEILKVESDEKICEKAAKMRRAEKNRLGALRRKETVPDKIARLYKKIQEMEYGEKVSKICNMYFSNQKPN
ncbi:hypothetical protein [Endozoicomonas sp. ONNA2]|uniref:hypothetical protein n=1 Tax=Endozoicomonas sp. ONNA2 TaxID=2828741 RepID=UPI002149955D|nr:hypothetical protein [Endozoicomonas sp. ONNA2]